MNHFLTQRLSNGRYGVNKIAVIAELRQRLRKNDVALPGLLPVSHVEISDELSRLTENRVDSLINTSEE